jgi:hypothetical protein
MGRKVRIKTPIRSHLDKKLLGEIGKKNYAIWSSFTTPQKITKSLVLNIN